MPAPERPERGGTVVVHLETFELLKTNRNWTDEKICARSDVSVKTLWRIRNGRRIRRINAQHLANAFGVPIETLLYGIHPAVAPPPSRAIRRHPVTLKLDLAYSEMTEEKQDEVLLLLQKVIGANSAITKRDVTPGSVTLCLEMSRGDILRLLASMVDHEVELLRIKRILVGDDSWLKIMLAMLEVGEGAWLDLDDETWSDYVWDRPFRSLGIKTKDCTFCKGME